MYIVMIKGHVIGLFTSSVDAHNVAEDHPYKIIYYCKPNSCDVVIYEKNYEGNLKSFMFFD